MVASKTQRLMQALLLVAVFVANWVITLKLPVSPGIECNTGTAFPCNTAPEAWQYRNPVTMPAGQNLADPAVIRHGGRYYMTGTGPGHYTGDIQLWSSIDLVNWASEGIIYHAPRNPGDWNMYMFWAAEIFVLGGYYYLSYSASPDQVMQHHRIGIARATSITGPYVDMKDEPLFDLHQETIDQHVFDHGGMPYMYYTNHDPAARGIYVVQLAPDLNGTTGPHVLVLEKTQDETLIEAPWLVKRDGVYYLLFSANGADTPEYRVSVATSNSPFGPFTRRGHVITKNWWIPGPGHCSAVPSPDGSELFIVYHAKTSWGTSWDREVCIDRLLFEEDETMHAFGPTRDPQPLPAGVNGSAGVVPIANAGFESTGLPGWILEEPWDASLYSFMVSSSTASRIAAGSGCACHGERMLWFWSTISFPGSIRQEIGGVAGNRSCQLVAWAGSHGRQVTITVSTGGQVLATGTTSGTIVTRISLEFTTPPGNVSLSITASSP
ncbi:MAG: family 43 glycosylhydrolase, partial [Candidatus Lokiarchaeota archaeon]|nr:family 43 glycosylhydrolase [Candidatus Lokiarchaeota archaeon]